MPTATINTTAQRALLNYLHDLPTNSKKRTATELVHGIGVSGDDIRGLHKDCLVEGRLASGIPVDIADQPHLTNVHLHLTSSGLSWVRGNPLNKLLRTLDTSRQIRLRDAVRAMDKPTVREAWESRHVTVQFAGDGREVSRLTDYDFQHAADYTVQLTSKGHQALGPKP